MDRHLDPVILPGFHAENGRRRRSALVGQAFSGNAYPTVMAVDKRNHAQKDDILVDDQLKARVCRGIFVHHENAESMIAKLAVLSADVCDPITAETKGIARGAHG